MGSVSISHESLLHEPGLCNVQIQLMSVLILAAILDLEALFKWSVAHGLMARVHLQRVHLHFAS